MKTIIVYATKSGATLECAELLMSKLPDSKIVSVKEKIINILDYDTIVIGSGVRMGKIYKPIRKFIEKNLDVLIEKKTALFICNGDPLSVEPTINKCIPRELIDSTICIKSFGGKMPFRKTNNQDWMNKENINDFVNAIANN